MTELSIDNLPGSLRLAEKFRTVTLLLNKDSGPLDGGAMAMGGTVMPRGDKMDRDQLGIQGQGLMTSRSQDNNSLQVPSTSSDSTPSTSRPSSTGTSSYAETGETLGSFKMPVEAVGVLESVINMNKALEQQIEALRLRLNVEAKHHDSEKQKIVSEKEKELNKKEEEVEDLRDSLVNRDERITLLVKEGEQKDIDIHAKVQEISDLKKLMKETETFASALHRKVDKLKVDKSKLESDSVYKEQNEELKKLRIELGTMKDKIGAMEKELGRAKHIIDQQNSKIRGLEFEKTAMNEKFKEELDKASKAMRQEVERMREVMKQQYIEMRNLREQNVGISSDVRDIKDLLLQGTIQPQADFKNNDLSEPHHLRTPRALPKSPNYGTRGAVTSRLEPPKQQGVMQASIPAMSNLRLKSSGNLPPISGNDGRQGGPHWVPNSKQAFQHRYAKAKKK